MQDEKIKVVPKVQGWLIIGLIILAIIVVLFLLSPAMIKLPPEAIWIVGAVFILVVIFYLFKSNPKPKNMFDILDEVSEEVHTRSGVLLNIQPNNAQVKPISDDQFLVSFLNPLLTFTYSPRKGIYGGEIELLSKFVESMEASKIYESFGKQTKAEEIIKQMEERYGVSINR